MITTIVNVSDIRNNWTQVAKQARKGKVVVIQNSKVSFVITPAALDDAVGFVLDAKTKKTLAKSKKDLDTGKYKEGNTNDVMEWLAN